MRTRVLFAVVSLAALTLAGCASHQGKTAISAYGSLKSEAQSWASDAVGLGFAGLEMSSIENMTEQWGDLGSELTAVADTSPGDGYAPMWAAGFLSPSKGKILVVALDGSGIRHVMEQAFPGMEQLPQQALDALAKAESALSVDSPAAIKAVRAGNATLDAAFNAPNGTVSVVYGADFEDGEYEIQGTVGTVWFSASVDFATGEVNKLKVKEDYVHKPIVVVPRELPLPIHQTGTVDVSADPLNIATQVPCDSPTAQCTRIPFELKDAATVEAKLTWGTPGDDFDLYIYQGATQVSSDGINSLGSTNPSDYTTTQQTMHAELEPGQYEFVIVPWSAVQDTWTFDATFA